MSLNSAGKYKKHTNKMFVKECFSAQKEELLRITTKACFPRAGLCRSKLVWEMFYDVIKLILWEDLIHPVRWKLYMMKLGQDEPHIQQLVKES